MNTEVKTKAEIKAKIRELFADEIDGRMIRTNLFISNTYIPNENGVGDKIKAFTNWLGFQLNKSESTWNTSYDVAIPFRIVSDSYNGRNPILYICTMTDRRWTTQDRASIDTIANNLEVASKLVRQALPQIADLALAKSDCQNERHIGQAIKMQRVKLSDTKRELWCIACRDADRKRIK